jgi:hypothetical protein
MKESHREGVASHPDPESCAASRKAGREALPRRKAIPMEAPTRASKGLRAVREPKHAWKLHAREPGDPSNARHDFVSGPVGEGHEPEVQHAR